MVDTIRMNGVVVYQRQDLLARLEQELQSTKERLEAESNRATRRSKNFKKILALIGFIGAIGVTCATKAYASNGALATASIQEPSLWKWVLDKMVGGVIPGMPDGFSMNREDSFGWKFAHYMTSTLFNTRDFFSNSSVLHIFNVIWYITMSFSTLMIGKKGMDMVKARTLGSSTSGAPEFIIRLLASVLMSFFSLDIVSLGIHLSNISISVLMNNIAKGAMNFENFTVFSESFLGSFFWFLGYTILFVVLGVRYWIRQINLIVLGCIAPIANMAWVTDGGSMLGTLIKEMIVSLTTPIAQAITLGIGTTILFEVNAHNGGDFVGFLNTVLIGISTMFMMIFTPEFLRKFVHGSANPLKYAFDLFTKAKALPGRMMSAIK
jgi:hypothetical protein